MGCEPDDLRFKALAFPEFLKFRIRVIKDNEIVFRLVDRDRFFAADIVRHGLMAVQMVRCDIQYRADVRLKLADRLQHKRTDLDDRRGFLGCLQRLIGERFADVAGNMYILIMFLQDLADQRGSRCFSVGAGNGSQLSLGCLISQFQFADDRDLCVIQHGNKTAVHGNAGAHDREVHSP